MARARIYRNSPQCFLVGASWSHDDLHWSQRLTHIYLGPFVLTIETRGKGNN